MFRNVVYSGRDNEITLFTWDEQGDRVTKKIPYKPYLYIKKDGGTDGVSIYNEPLHKMVFDNKKERETFAKTFKNVYYNVPPEQQFLIDKFNGQNKSETFGQNPLKIFYLDIEVYSPNFFPNPHEAEAPINLITVLDSLSNIFHTFGTKPYYGDLTSQNVIYHEYVDEFEMLRGFVKFWRKDFPDIVTGWFSDSFDIPYIMNRINKLYALNKVYEGEDAANRLSPLGYTFCMENVERRFENYDKLWYMQGITLFDYMYIYKVFTRESRESYSLDNIAQVELGVGKHAVNKVSLSEMADNDWDKFVEYNIQDVRLVKMLEEKLRYIEICKKIGYLSLTPYKKAESTVAVVTGIIAQKALSQGKIISTFVKSEDKTFEGGFVRDSKLGRQEDILYFDVNSLYPNTIVSLNLSPETKLGTIQRNDTNVKIITKNGKEVSISSEKFNTFVTENEVSISEADVIFTQKVKGLVPSIIEEIYGERVAVKKNGKKLSENKIKLTKEIKGDMSERDQKIQQKIAELEYKMRQDDIYQYVIKILLNKIYGYFAEKSSPFYDLDLAKSITFTGQSCIKEAADIVTHFIKKEYDMEYDSIVFGDTDSVGITIHPILEKLNIKSDLNDEINPDVFKIALQFKEVIDRKINKWSKSKLNSKWSKYEFKLESISTAAIFVKKKNYVLEMICDEDGRSFYDDKGKKLRRKYKYTGLEVVKTSTPKKLKPMIKKIIELLITEPDKQKISEHVKKIYEKYIELTTEEIAVPISLNNYDKYEEKSTGFKIGLHTPIQVKSAIYYNRLLEKHKIEGKYEKLKSGNKIKFLILEKNNLGIRTIAFLFEFPTELSYLVVDKPAMFKKTVLKPLERIFKVLKMDIPSPTTSEKNNLVAMFS